LTKVAPGFIVPAMSYCVMRMAKIKSRVSLLRSALHNTRERTPPNADRARSGDNLTSGGSAADVMDRYSRMLPQKVRKNAVHAVEIVMTASPDFAGDWTAYEKDCRRWVAGVFGEKNVLHAACHRDESTPHVHMLVMPLKDGTLNAKHFIGGSRDRMTELQDDFYEKVGKPLDLERGRSRAETRARHTPHTLALKTAALDKREKQISAVLRCRPDEAAKAISVFRELKTLTPSNFRNLADRIQKEHCATWWEYHEKMQRQSDLQKKQQQQRKGGFHR
jgi:hypothetical protein